MRRIVLPLALAAVSLTHAPATATGSCDWPMYGHDPGHSFRQVDACSTIDPTSVPTMRPKWFHRTNVPITASPSIADGVVYVGAWDGTFYAFDADAGPGPVEPLWTYQIEDDSNNVAFGRIVSSAAVTDIEDSRVIVFAGGSTVYVLNTDGQRLTSLCLDPRSSGRCQGSSADIEIESSPAVVTRPNGEVWVIIGHSVHNRSGIGRTGVVAMRLDTTPWSLVPLWKFDPETKQTYTTDATQTGPLFVHTSDPLTYGAGTGAGCGGVWSSPAVDDSMVYLGTANCTTPGAPGGESAYGVDLETGGYRWVYSPRLERGEPSNLDDDFGASPNLLPGGRVGFPGKDGWYYARDRVTGDPAWTNHVGQSGRINSNFSIGGITGTPAVGEVNGEPAVFATTAISTPIGRPITGPPGPGNLDGSLAEDPGRMLSLHAISALNGRLLWRSPLSRQSYGAPTYSRGVLFVPSTFDFSVKAFHADTGAQLAELPVNGAPSSAPAIVGDSIYVGAGTTQEGLPFGQLAGLWAFELAY